MLKIDSRLQKEVQVSPKKRILHAEYHSSIPRHSDEQCMYHTMWKDFFCWRNPNEVFDIVSGCPKCTLVLEGMNWKRHLQLLASDVINVLPWLYLAQCRKQRTKTNLFRSYHRLRKADKSTSHVKDDDYAYSDIDFWWLDCSSWNTRLLLA